MVQVHTEGKGKRATMSSNFWYFVHFNSIFFFPRPSVGFHVLILETGRRKWRAGDLAGGHRLPNQSHQPTSDGGLSRDGREPDRDGASKVFTSLDRNRHMFLIGIGSPSWSARKPYRWRSSRGRSSRLSPSRRPLRQPTNSQLCLARGLIFSQTW